MWPAENTMQSMRPAVLCRFPTPVLSELDAAIPLVFAAGDNVEE